MPTWNPAEYLQFADERTRPCRELAARVALDAPKRIVDLGCGPGNSTEVLATRWPDAKLVGIDHSPEMIASAEKAQIKADWVIGDISVWSASQPVDLLFSNAALQWVDDHATQFVRLFAQVSAGGALAVQMPGNFDAPAHSLMRELASSPAWRAEFAEPVREWTVEEPAFYYDTLSQHAKKIDLWTTEYHQVMPDSQAIVDWYKGTGLRPFLDQLSASSAARFLDDYLKLITVAYPTRADGRVLFPFNRLFLIAYR